MRKLEMVIKECGDCPYLRKTWSNTWCEKTQRDCNDEKIPDFCPLPKVEGKKDEQKD